jgi:hypothetical protein
MNDNINMDSTIAGSMNDNIRVVGGIDDHDHCLKRENIVSYIDE